MFHIFLLFERRAGEDEFREKRSHPHGTPAVTVPIVIAYAKGNNLKIIWQSDCCLTSRIEVDFFETKSCVFGGFYC